MADRALTEEAMLAGLRDIRLPADAPGGLLAEILAALALGLLLAAVLGIGLRWLTARRASGAGGDKATLDSLPDEDQRLALLRRLKHAAPQRYAEIAAQIYRPGGLPDLAELRAEVGRHA